MISIRYKAMVPMGVLALVLLALIATAGYALSEAAALNRSLAGRYHEIEEVRQIEVGVSKLLSPFVFYLESGAAEHRQAAEAILEALDDRMRELRPMAVVNDQEREVLEYVTGQLAQIRRRSAEFFEAPGTDRRAMVQALDEITRLHFATLGAKLHEYHDEEMKQVDALAQRAEHLQERFRSAALAAMGVTAALLLLAIWINNRVLVQPILSISRSTAGIANGQLQQHVVVMSNDELGRLSNDINRMARALQTVYERMDQMAHTDALTGLPNRRAFEQIAQRELDAAHRYGRELGIIMVDVDHFKRINDSYGHGIGDEVLKFVARTCTTSLRASDTCFRIGGEEFVLLLREAGGDQAMMIAERCRHILADSPWSDVERTIPVTASFGVACAPGDGDTLHALLKAADSALYAAKKNGRNRVEGRCRGRSRIPPSSASDEVAAIE